MKKSFSHLAFICLFVILPAMLTSMFVNEFFEHENKSYYDKQFQKLNHSLTETLCNIQSEAFLLNTSKKIFESFRDNKLNKAKIETYCKELADELPIEFDLFLFDKGKLVSPKFLKFRSRAVGRRIWQLLALDNETRNQEYKKYKKLISGYLGSTFRVGRLLEERNSIIPIVTKFTNGGIYWNADSNDKSSGVMIVFWQIPEDEYIFKRVIEAERYKYADVFVAQSEKNALNKDLFRRLNLLKEKNIVENKEKIWNSVSYKDYFITASIKVSENFQSTKSTLFVFIILSAFSVLAFYAYYVFKKEISISIKYKIAGLFFAAFLVALGGFIYLGSLFIEDKHKSLMVKASNYSRSLLTRIDELFKSDNVSFDSKCYDICLKAKDFENEENLTALKELMNSDELISVEVRNASDSNLIFSFNHEILYEDLQNIYEIVAKLSLDNRFKSKLSEHSDKVMVDFITNPEIGLSPVIKQSNKAHLILFGSMPLASYWTLISKNGEELFVSVLMMANKVMGAKVIEKFNEFNDSSVFEPYRVAFVNNRTGVIFPDFMKEIQGFDSFNEQAFFAENLTESVFESNNKKFLITGQRARHARDFCFYSLYPIEKIDCEILLAKLYIVLGLLFFTITASLAGKMLADFFIVPIHSLAEGVEAISKRNIDYRISYSQNDEFGDLAERFNKMIAGLKEMQLAQDVQNSLLPGDVPNPDGYEIAFSNRMAAAVGGDYFDVFMCDKDKLCVIIGDVSGHGVSSALVMAMAKATLYHGFKENKNLVELFAELNKIINYYFGKSPVRKMITLFACIIDVSTGIGIFVNAGHNFPLLLKNDQSIEELSSIHLPIGSSKKTIKLEP
ncbi:MAG: SpoIIE family protein phosphatase, partial [Candidatus Riflebacteria bacterium]|nr:SpoIIE family protein phosphatase [Candidatus Riflebacteria bacterium]